MGAEWMEGVKDRCCFPVSATQHRAATAGAALYHNMEYVEQEIDMDVVVIDGATVLSVDSEQATVR